jgi:hypothetical protein
MGVWSPETDVSFYFLGEKPRFLESLSGRKNLLARVDNELVVDGERVSPFGFYSKLTRKDSND